MKISPLANNHDRVPLRFANSFVSRKAPSSQINFWVRQRDHLMNSYLNRISHFKGNPRQIGFAAGRKFAGRLEQTISHYIASVEDSKDLEKLHAGALPWLRTLPKRFQDEFVQTSHVRLLEKSGTHLGDTQQQAGEIGKNLIGHG